MNASEAAKMLSQALEAATNGIDIHQTSEVVHEGTKIILPEGMAIKQAIHDLQVQDQADERITKIDETVDCFPLDGAYAMELAIRNMFGWAEGKTVWTMYGPEHPARIAVEVDYGKTEYVNWGRFEIPGIEGWVHTTSTRASATEPAKFRVVAEVKRRHEPAIRNLVQAVRDHIKNGGSIYQGKAIRLHFDVDESFFGIECVASIKFMDLSEADPHKLIFAKSVENQIWDSIYEPIQDFDRLADIGVKFRRGILLAGKYGTGKTETAKAAGKMATEQGMTFVYCDDGDQLATTMLFVQPYANPGAVIFMEDIDRFVTGSRTEEMDRILNTLDGIDTKGFNIMTVMTTNNVENIHEAMLRPGRMDDVIYVLPPDAEAIERLIRMYAGSSLAATEDIRWVCEELAQVETIPAVIAEVVKRSKLSALRHTPRGQTLAISAHDLDTAAKGMANQLRLLNRVTPRELSNEERAALIHAEAWKEIAGTPLSTIHEVPQLSSSNGLRV